MRAVVGNLMRTSTQPNRRNGDFSAQTPILGWAQYVGRSGQSIGMETFGASAPLKELQKKFGFTLENVIASAKLQMAKAG